MEPVWTCRTPEEASQEGRSHVHTSTAPTSANEQHCRRWIGTPNCATFAAHKAGRLQALVDQSSSRIGRQEDRMHQATVSEIAVSCLAPRASATNDIAIARICMHGTGWVASQRLLRPEFTFDISHTNKILRAFCSALCRKGPVYIRHLDTRFACKTFGPNVLHSPNEMQCNSFGAK